MHKNPQKVAKTFNEILKFNDRHDPKTGRFAPKDGGSTLASNTGKFTQEQKDRYIELLNTDVKEATKYRREMKMSLGDTIEIKREATAAGKLKPKEEPQQPVAPKQPKPKVEEPKDDDYRMRHRPDAIGRGFDISEIGAIPKDVYDHPEWYFDMSDKSAKESMKVVREMRGNPDAEVTIYRASPKNEFNDGDWVTLSRSYAQGHAERESHGDVKLEVHSMKVKAKEIQFAGDSINEFGYFPNQANEKPVFKSTAQTFEEIIEKFNPYHGKDGRFTSANGAGAAAVSTAWTKKMDEEQEAILSKSVNKQAMFLWKSGFLDHDEAVEAMEDENTEIHIRNYFAIMKANGDPTSTKPLSDNKANRNSDVDSGKYKDHDDAKKGYIKEKTGVDDEEAAKISKEITTWTSNAWDDADTATIDRFIEKDHTYDGEIHRGMKFSAEDFDSFMANVQPGSTIGMKRNSSWSSDKADAATFSHVADDNVNSVMIRCVKNRTASPIAYLNSQGEREVVAHSKAKWTVLNVQTIENSWGAKKAWITVVEKGDYE